MPIGRERQSPKQVHRFSRRDFLGLGWKTATAVGLYSLLGPNLLRARAQEVKEIPTEIQIPPALMLHAKYEHRDLLPGLIDLLKTNSFTSVTYRDLYNALLTGKSLPPKPVMISIDDLTCLDPSQGTSFSMFEQMEKILADKGFRATFALITEPRIPIVGTQEFEVDKQSAVRWEEVTKWISEDGMEIADHTKNHENLLDRGLSLRDIRDQIICAKNVIEQETGQVVTTLILPFGAGANPNTDAIRHEIRQVCQEEGILFVVGINGGKGKLKPDPNGKPGQVFYTGRAEPGMTDKTSNAVTAFWELTHFIR